MKTKKVFLWTIVVLFAVGAVCLFPLWRYIYTPVSIGKMERFYKKHCVEMEQLAAYANRAVDDGAYLWLHLFPNGDEGLYIRARGTADTLRHLSAAEDHWLHRHQRQPRPPPDADTLHVWRPIRRILLWLQPIQRSDDC